MIPTRERRWIGRLIKVGLAGLAVVVVMAWIQFHRRGPGDTNRVSVRGKLSGVKIQTEVPAAEALGPGDMRIVNRDSSVNLILQGDRILAGLSPQTIDKVRREMEQSTADDTAGIGGTIARAVKQTVVSSIGVHVTYAVRDIESIEYTNDHIVIVRRGGDRTSLFSSVKTDGQEVGRTFAPDDARRFVEAVRARKKALESGEF